MALSLRESTLSKFSSHSDNAPVFVPDLRIWYKWQTTFNRLPAQWQGKSLDDIYRDLSIPIWRVVRPWKIESPHATETSGTPAGERATTIAVNGREITSRWTLGPDGDYWQTEYPIKTVDDLNALLSYVQSRTFGIDLDAVEKACAEVADDGVVAVELPARPFSWLMLEMLGWSDGVMLLLDEQEIVRTIVDAADRQLQNLVSRLAECSATLFYSPDNLDGQFVSPTFFSEYLADSYATAVRALHENGKRLVVHAGGPVKAIIDSVAHAGIDAVAGVCGPPQGDTPIPEARAVAGESLVLVGGIPQDHLLPSVEASKLEESLDQIVSEVRDDPRIIVSIADHVPIDADIDRLVATARRFSPDAMGGLL